MIPAYFRNLCRALLGADSVILTELSTIRQELNTMDAALTRLSGLADQIIAKLNIPTTEDADINAISDKLEAALASPGTDTSGAAVAAPAATLDLSATDALPAGAVGRDANGVPIDANGQPIAQ